MSDYIKREDAQKITAEWLSGYINDDERNVIEHIDVDIGELPPADVVEIGKPYFYEEGYVLKDFHNGGVHRYFVIERADNEQIH